MLDGSDFSEILDETFADALKKKGYTQLTPVQMAVLDPALSGRDLRITSQTGSGKTVALGFALRDVAGEHTNTERGIARPRALIVAPTRELAKQVEQELSWLYASRRARIASATGGTNVRDERRALAAAPNIVVGTPGRLLDHMNRGAIDGSQIEAIVIDEADRMLDMGFREDLESILSFAPPEHRTHLVSATFPRDVQDLANRVQRDVAHVQGTPLGEANCDIDHVVHLVDPEQRLDAIINLLLAKPEEQTLVFARTRVEVARLTAELKAQGFMVSSLSGQMEQEARDRALHAFRSGALQVLIATDVAARGIDVQGISRVIHADPPADPDSYTHRSGRTGRAGRKGTSAVLVSLATLRKTLLVLRAAGIHHHFEALPTAEKIRQMQDEKLLTELTAAPEENAAGFDPRTWGLAQRLSESGDPTRVIAQLLSQTRQAKGAQPRAVRFIEPPVERKPRPAAGPQGGPQSDQWVAFRVTWGMVHGADARRLLALVCRRGDIRGSDVGVIRINGTFSVVEVRANVAEGFAKNASRPDPRDRRVMIRPERPQAAQPKPPINAPWLGKNASKHQDAEPSLPAAIPPWRAKKAAGFAAALLEGEKRPKRRFTN